VSAERAHAEGAVAHDKLVKVLHGENGSVREA
jgi:hypothetical protein